MDKSSLIVGFVTTQPLSFKYSNDDSNKTKGVSFVVQTTKLQGKYHMIRFIHSSLVLSMQSVSTSPLSLALPLFATCHDSNNNTSNNINDTDYYCDILATAPPATTPATTATTPTTTILATTSTTQPLATTSSLTSNNNNNIVNDNTSNNKSY